MSLARSAIVIEARSSTRGKLSDQMVDCARHGRGCREVEFVDGNEGADSARRRESRVAEDALQPAGLLQYQREIAVRLHDNPAKRDGIHLTGLVETIHRIEAIALKICSMIGDPYSRVFRGKAIEVPGQPAQDVVGSRIEPACARSDQRRQYSGERFTVEIMTLQ